MAPNLEEFIPNNAPPPSLSTSTLGPGPTLILRPLSTIISNREMEIIPSSPSPSQQRINVVKVNLPLEQNLWELLVRHTKKRVTNTEDLESLTQVKLRVITREVPLQHLSIYTPALRELILDGSIVSTLRDLGCGLKNLKILRVNRCNLYYFDGIFSFEGLEELYAADNYIENIIPCAFLSNLKALDLSRNRLKNFNALKCLTVCESLEHLNLMGNNEISQSPNYRHDIKTLLPELKSLDGIIYNNDNNESDATNIQESTIPSPQNNDNLMPLERCSGIIERNKVIRGREAGYEEMNFSPKHGSIVCKVGMIK